MALVANVIILVRAVRKAHVEEQAVRMREGHHRKCAR